MGCPTNCGNRPPIERPIRFQDNETVKADLDVIDRRSSDALARARRDFGVLLCGVVSLTGAALSAQDRSLEFARAAGLVTALGSSLILRGFDTLFHHTRRCLIADIRERVKCADNLCPEVRTRRGFQIPAVQVRAVELDLRWYATASYLAVVCLTIGLVLSLDPGLNKLDTSPLDLAAVAILGSNPFWILVLRRVARNQFQLLMEWKCGSTRVHERLFRAELLHTIRRRSPRLEVRRSGFAGAALTLSIVGLLVVNHPGQWVRVCCAIAIVGLNFLYWYCYSRYNAIAGTVHVEGKVTCPFESVVDVACPRRIGNPAVLVNPTRA